MSSIQGKNTDLSLLNLADVSPAEAGAQSAAPLAADEAKIKELLAKEGDMAAFAMMGMGATGLSRVLRGEPSNKYSIAATITSTPPPLPLDRAPITQNTQALFTSLQAEVASATAAAQPKGTAARQVGASATQQPGNTMMNELAAITEEEAQTPEGQKKVETAVHNGLKSAGIDLGTLSSNGMMAAFMLLQVQNKSSGKEVTSVLQDLTAEARSNSIDMQIMQNKAAQEATAKARKKQEKMGKLAPLLEGLMLLLTAAITVLTAGSGTALMLACAGAVLGFIVGGAVGGSKKGNGFDLGSAFGGAAMGMGVAAIAAKVIVKMMEMISKLLLKVGSTRALGAGMGRAAATTNQRLDGGAGLNLSNKANQAALVTATTLQSVTPLVKEVMLYKHDMILADAKEAQAHAKMEKAISDMLQNQFQTLSASLQSMVQRRNKSVDQASAMLKTYQSVMQKAISNIAG